MSRPSDSDNWLEVVRKIPIALTTWPWSLVRIPTAIGVNIGDTMSANSLPDVAKLAVIQRMIAEGFFNGLVLHLMGSNLTPETSTTLAELLAVEATFPGYGPTSLSIPFGTSVTPGGAAGTMMTATFTPTGVGGSGNVWGWFITDNTMSLLLGVAIVANAPVSVPFPLTYQATVLWEVNSL